MSDIERLVALKEIEQLEARRDRAVDMKDWDTYFARHAPDQQSRNDGCAPWLRAAEMIANVSRLLNETNISAHHSHSPDIAFASPMSATGMWGMEDNIFGEQGQEEHWLQGFGCYLETYQKRDGHWLFTSQQLKPTHVRMSPGAILDPDAR